MAMVAMVTIVVKLQAVVYHILPSTTAITDYAIRLEKTVC